MAVRGTFTQELLPEGWFDETLKPEGWFSGDFLEPSAAGGDANFAGTATLAFGQSGTFTAGAAIAASTAITFGQTGSFRAGAGLAGGTSLTFSQTGALRGGSGLAGTATVTFGQSGDFVAGAAPGDAVFAGTATIVFNATGAFEAGLGTAPIGDGRSRIGYAVKPTKVYRPFDRDIEAIQAVLEKAAPKPEIAEKPKRKREIVRQVVAETTRIIEGEGLIANRAVRQEAKAAAFEFVLPVFQANEPDMTALRLAIEQMLQQAADEAYRQQVLEFEAMQAFEADEDDTLCLLLAA